MGSAMMIRVFFNLFIYMMLSIVILLTVFDNTVFYLAFWYAGWAAGMAYALRTFIIAFLMLFALWFDDYAYYTDETTLGYFGNSVGWGSRMSTAVGQDDFFMMLDIQYEGANLVVGMMAGAFYEVGMSVWKPLHAQGYGSVPYSPDQANKAKVKKVV